MVLSNRSIRKAGTPYLLVVPALVFAIGFTLGLHRPAASRPSCFCAPQPPPREAMDEAAAVFDGTVARIERATPGDPAATMTVTLIAHTQWKGITQSPVVVTTAADSAVCGYPFRLGQRYLVYARQSEGVLTVNTCSRTRIYDAAEASELGPNEPPAAAIPYAVWSAPPQPVPCPDCAPTLSPPAARDAADAAFHGQLVAIEDLGPERGHDHLVVYGNRGWWKGASEPFVRVRLPYALWYCDRWLWVGTGGDDGLPSWGEHLAFAMRGGDGGWELRLCGQTRLYQEADAAALGPAQVAATPVPVATPTAGGGSTATATDSATATVDPASTSTPTPTPAFTATPLACPTLECPGCPGPRPVREWLAEADAVFLGRVVAVRYLGCDHLVTFENLERFKGPVTATVDVFVGILSWQCMRRYEPGTEVVVFARADTDGRLTIPMCFGITAGDALAELRGDRGTAVPLERVLLPRLTSR